MSTSRSERQVGIGVALLALLLLAAMSWPVLKDLAAADPFEPADPATSATPDSAEDPSGEPAIFRTLFREDFEDGARGWRVLEHGSGKVSSSQGHAVLAVPRSPAPPTVAALRRTFDEPVRDLTVTGRFQVSKGGCDRAAPGSRGNVPFVRLFDPTGIRLVSLYRVNGDCGRNADVYVDHSGGFHQTSARISLGEWVELELHTTSPRAGQGVLRVSVDGEPVYETDRADHGGQPFVAVGLHNEVPYQVGVLEIDRVSAVTQVEAAQPAARPAPQMCPGTPRGALPDSDAPGSRVVADGFETGRLAGWKVHASGGASARVGAAAAHTGSCGLRLSSVADEGRLFLSHPLPDRTRVVHTDGRYLLRQGGADASNVPIIRVFAGERRIFDIHRQNGNGYVRARTTDSRARVREYDLGPVIEYGEWHRFRARLVADGRASRFSVTMDGTEVFRSGRITLPDRAPTHVLLGSEHLGQHLVLDVDDIVITAQRRR